MLSLFRRLVALRREQVALVLGSVRLLAAGEDEDVLAYVREHDGRRLLVALHLGAHATTVDVSDEGASGEVLCATGLDREGDDRPRPAGARGARGPDRAPGLRAAAQPPRSSSSSESACLSTNDGPMPLIASSSPGVAGRRRTTSRSVASVATV